MKMKKSHNSGMPELSAHRQKIPGNNAGDPEEQFTLQCRITKMPTGYLCLR